MGLPLNFSLRGEVIVLAVCLLLSLTLLSLSEEDQILIADRLGSVLTAPYWWVKNFSEDILSTRNENAWLEQRVAELELMAASTERMQRDAQRLAGPGVDPGYDGELVPCRVVMRQRARFATMIKIVSLEDVDWLPRQPVISKSGYLGRVSQRINERSAWVELMSSPDFALGVELERTGLLGILRPRGDGFELEMIGRDADVLKGDRVITSGIAEIREDPDQPNAWALSTRGFPVGEVSLVEAPGEQIFKRIVVSPAASFDHNETVFVVTPFAGAEPANGGRGR